jgi:predicted dienelactone hydrolase
MLFCSAVKRRLLHTSLALGCLTAAPAMALEQFVIAIPLLETGITIDLGEVESADAVLSGNSDLAELARAGGRALADRLARLFQAPLPRELQAIDPAVGDPLVQQVLAGISQLIEVEGASIDTSGQSLAEAMRRARLAGQPTVLGLLRELPGTTATVDLGKVLLFAARLRRNQALGRQLVAEVSPQPVDATQPPQGPAAIRSGGFELLVEHRPEPMRVLWVRPEGPASGATLVISHGLWDSPKSFLGWAHYLASHGHVVLLPVHQGSDQDQQSAMVAGDQPPPGSAELHLRPTDVSALLTALEERQPTSLGVLPAGKVGVIGHSWGAITSLQLGGLRPMRHEQAERCEDQWDPERNLSWALQCSLLSGGTAPDLFDPRVGAVVAVSPPARLLFDAQSGSSLQVPGLIVSGTSDWVVPSGPEAITPFTLAKAGKKGHRLVLAEGGDHFNLRAPIPTERGALGRLIRAWIQSRLAPLTVESIPSAGAAMFTALPWGDTEIPLVDVSAEVPLSP